MMSSVRSQLELLDARIAEFQHMVESEGEEIVPIDLEIDVLSDIVPESEVVAEVEEPVADDDLPFGDFPEPSVELEEDLPVFEEPEPEPVQEPEPEPEPLLMPEPEPSAQTAAESVPQHSSVAVIDSMTDRQAWRTDMPGTAVKDIRSAISLNDRIIFINYLFNEDPLAFQDALTEINRISSLDDAVSMLMARYPEWDMGSDVVYRFMMAVRRKIR